MLGINLTYLTFLKVPLCFNLSVQFSSVQSVAQSCPTL